MSPRTLRLVISVAFVFAVFIYMLSSSLNTMLPTKALDEGLPGGPIPGLTRWQLAKFEEGRALFKKKFSVADGLGPLYNGVSCASCHGGSGIAGGAGPDPDTSSYKIIARRKADGRFATENPKAAKTKVEMSDLDFLRDKGGPVLLGKSISDAGSESGLPKDCALLASKEAPKECEYKSLRYAPPLFGLGLVETVPERLFSFQAGRQAQNPKGPQGKTVRLPLFFGDTTGRFGHKADKSSLMNCIASELGTQLGLSNPLFRHSLTNAGVDKVPECMKAVIPQDPNLDAKTLAKLNFFLCCLAPPPPAAQNIDGQLGNSVFQKTGCAVCHMPQMQTPDTVMLINPDEDFAISERRIANDGSSELFIEKEPKFVRIKALENVVFRPYSDFLIHDMGQRLADGIAQAGGTTGAEWRTAPLWGLRTRRYYLHDGRAATLEEAIAQHGGQAAESAKSFAKLSELEKKQLLAFLNSL